MGTQDINFMADRLRKMATDGDGYFAQDDIRRLFAAADSMAEAAAEITRLRAEVERLREALREIAEAQLYYDYIGADETGKISLHVPGSPYDRGKRDGAELLSARARKALEGGE